MDRVAFFMPIMNIGDRECPYIFDPWDYVNHRARPFPKIYFIYFVPFLNFYLAISVPFLNFYVATGAL